MVRPSVNLDMDALRTLVTGIDLGSFVKAADRLGRSPSAVSLHLRKLESQIGQKLVRKQGRGLVLTEAGETLLSYARRLLDLNDETCMALGSLTDMEGWVRIGVPSDFAETWLPSLLARFERGFPKVRMEVRADPGAKMVEAVQTGRLDFAVTWGRLGNAESELVGQRRLVWIAAPDYHPDPGEPLSLVAIDTPCAFREAAIVALDGMGKPWRHSFATTSLSGVWAAVTAGLGVTVRTADAAPPHLKIINPGDDGLPDLGSIELALHGGAAPSMEPVRLFKTLLLESIG
ncbi:LysR family transcriptional regulator [Aureimonas sp. Leaf460]|nr:LysR family transcriptional regulator [Aureimonas sp. Leaf427]KQT81065.1 LysR family transcriptional regulator [Aureimonas sp. Leaf460]